MVLGNKKSNSPLSGVLLGRYACAKHLEKASSHSQEFLEEPNGSLLNASNDGKKFREQNLKGREGYE